MHVNCDGYVRMEVLEQLHLAPSMYLATVLEVVRRRSFSEHYLGTGTSITIFVICTSVS
jgi:hypothetical protein